MRPFNGDIASASSPCFSRALTAWTGRTSGLFLRSIRLFKFTWANPRPEEKVVTLDFQSVVSEAAPFLIALTVE